MGAEARCWCGGEVGPREPGDDEGRGCLEDIYHDWHGGAGVSGVVVCLLVVVGVVLWVRS